MPVIDWDDACARARELRHAKFRMLAGQQEWEFTYSGNGVQRSVRYTQVNIAELEEALREAEKECAVATGGTAPKKRFAIQAGSRRF